MTAKMSRMTVPSEKRFVKFCTRGVMVLFYGYDGKTQPVSFAMFASVFTPVELEPLGKTHVG